jgi:hypothetical protein
MNQQEELTIMNDEIIIKTFEKYKQYIDAESYEKLISFSKNANITMFSKILNIHCESSDVRNSLSKDFEFLFGSENVSKMKNTDILDTKINSFSKYPDVPYVVMNDHWYPVLYSNDIFTKPILIFDSDNVNVPETTLNNIIERKNIHYTHFSDIMNPILMTNVSRSNIILFTHSSYILPESLIEKSDFMSIPNILDWGNDKAPIVTDIFRCLDYSSQIKREEHISNETVDSFGNLNTLEKWNKSMTNTDYDKLTHFVECSLKSIKIQDRFLVITGGSQFDKIMLYRDIIRNFKLSDVVHKSCHNQICEGIHSTQSTSRVIDSIGIPILHDSNVDNDIVLKTKKLLIFDDINGIDTGFIKLTVSNDKIMTRPFFGEQSVYVPKVNIILIVSDLDSLEPAMKRRSIVINLTDNILKREHDDFELPRNKVQKI